MNSLYFASVPSLVQWAAICTASFDVCQTLGLVTQRDVTLSNQAEILQNALAPRHLDRLRGRSWPGSEVGPSEEDFEYLDRYKWDADTLERINAVSKVVPLLWQSPDLPEDIHLLRQDGSVYLGSTTTEAFAWLNLTESELSRLRSLVPQTEGLFANVERSFTAGVLGED